MNNCLDCGLKKGVFPAILTVEGEVQRVCVQCWNRDWSVAMHGLSCDCPHCKNCREKLS